MSQRQRVVYYGQWLQALHMEMSKVDRGYRVLCSRNLWVQMAHHLRVHRIQCDKQYFTLDVTLSLLPDTLLADPAASSDDEEWVKPRLKRLKNIAAETFDSLCAGSFSRQ